MDKKTVIITELEGKYQIQNFGISEFALIGILECIIFDMKTAKRESPVVKKEEMIGESKQLVDREVNKSSNTADLRIRIGNALKAIGDLGGNIKETNLNDLSDEELQTQLQELTSQYKILKNLKKASK